MNYFNPAETTANYSQLGVTKTSYPPWKSFLLAIFAGMMISLAAAVTNTASFDFDNISAIRLISGLLFPFGLGIIMMTGTELFTGSCLISISVWDKKVSLVKMLKNWCIVYSGNLVGGMLVSAGCALFGQLSYSQGALAAYTMKVAASKCAISFQNGVVMGFFCNILVCLGVFIALTGKDTAGRIIGAYIPVALFVICGFEHCIANMYYIPAGLFAMNVPAYAAKAAEMGINTDALTWGNFFLRNLVPVTIGNILGGVSLGTLMWVCHLRAPKNKGA